MVVFMLVLTFIHLVINPAINFSGDLALDLKDAMQVKLETQKLAHAVSDAAFSGIDGKKSVWIFIPLSSEIECKSAEKKFVFTTTIRQESNLCASKKCTGEISVAMPAGVAIDCTNFGSIGKINGQSTPKALISALRSKSGGETVNVWRSE